RPQGPAPAPSAGMPGAKRPRGGGGSWAEEDEAPASQFEEELALMEEMEAERRLQEQEEEELHVPPEGAAMGQLPASARDARWLRPAPPALDPGQALAFRAINVGSWEGPSSPGPAPCPSPARPGSPLLPPPPGPQAPILRGSRETQGPPPLPEPGLTLLPRCPWFSQTRGILIQIPLGPVGARPLRPPLTFAPPLAPA
uniref:Uncharacterized protein n=1 Tax=Sarcophilus harrisii TaxID=9305 RepID=A0A7N4PDJ0_SARHA